MIGNSPPPKTPLFSYPQNKFFLRKIVFKKIFRFFAWISFDKLAVKVDRSGVRMPGGWGTYAGGIFCSKELPLLFEIFLYKFKAIFPKKLFYFWEILVLGYVSRGGMFRSQKKASDAKIHHNFFCKISAIFRPKKDKVKA